VPRQVFFYPEALDHERGRSLLQRFSDCAGVEVVRLSSRRLPGSGEANPRTAYLKAKRTLLVDAWRRSEFEDLGRNRYRLPITSGCPGLCDYCYLQASQGSRAFIKVNVNTGDILARAEDYLSRVEDEVVLVAEPSDPLPTEEYTGALAAAIELAGRYEGARLGFLTKFDNVDSLLGLNHRGHTRVRFSINNDRVIASFERGAPGLRHRLAAIGRLVAAGYLVDVLVRPVMIYAGWEADYRTMLLQMNDVLSPHAGVLSMEVALHRFSAREKAAILSFHPESSLPLEESARVERGGQFGQRTFVYPSELARQVRDFFRDNAGDVLPGLTLKRVY
jgi:spore photoproduct lyase